MRTVHLTLLYNSPAQFLTSHLFLSLPHRLSTSCNLIRLTQFELHDFENNPGYPHHLQLRNTPLQYASTCANESYRAQEQL
eukprot:3008764-Amphidinium_carterae.1